jgi:hypothetical protein
MLRIALVTPLREIACRMEGAACSSRGVAHTGNVEWMLAEWLAPETADAFLRTRFHTQAFARADVAGDAIPRFR